MAQLQMSTVVDAATMSSPWRVRTVVAGLRLLTQTRRRTTDEQVKSWCMTVTQLCSSTVSPLNGSWNRHLLFMAELCWKNNTVTRFLSRTLKAAVLAGTDDVIVACMHAIRALCGDGYASLRDATPWQRKLRTAGLHFNMVTVLSMYKAQQCDQHAMDVWYEACLTLRALGCDGDCCMDTALFCRRPDALDSIVDMYTRCATTTEDEEKQQEVEVEQQALKHEWRTAACLDALCALSYADTSSLRGAGAETLARHTLTLLQRYKTSAHMQVRGWCLLANLVSNSAPVTSVLLSRGVVPVLEDTLHRFADDADVVLRACCVLAFVTFMCRDRAGVHALRAANMVALVTNNLHRHRRHVRAMLYSVWALTNMTQNSPLVDLETQEAVRSQVMHSRVLQDVLTALQQRGRFAEVTYMAVGLLANLSAVCADRKALLHKAGAMDVVMDCLAREPRNCAIVNYSVMMLSNMTSCTTIAMNDNTVHRLSQLLVEVLRWHTTPHGCRRCLEVASGSLCTTVVTMLHNLCVLHKAVDVVVAAGTVPMVVTTMEAQRLRGSKCDWGLVLDCVNYVRMLLTMDVSSTSLQLLDSAVSSCVHEVGLAVSNACLPRAVRASAFALQLCMTERAVQAMQL